MSLCAVHDDGALTQEVANRLTTRHRRRLPFLSLINAVFSANRLGSDAEPTFYHAVIVADNETPSTPPTISDETSVKAVTVTPLGITCSRRLSRVPRFARARVGDVKTKKKKVSTHSVRHCASCCSRFRSLVSARTSFIRLAAAAVFGGPSTTVNNGSVRRMLCVCVCVCVPVNCCWAFGSLLHC